MKNIGSYHRGIFDELTHGTRCMRQTILDMIGSNLSTAIQTKRRIDSGLFTNTFCLVPATLRANKRWNRLTFSQKQKVLHVHSGVALPLTEYFTLVALDMMVARINRSATYAQHSHSIKLKTARKFGVEITNAECAIRELNRY